jgi:HlyD family secretion protein
MGKKTVFSRVATERKDLEVIQVLVDLDEPLAAPVGLQVDVQVRVGE